MNCPVIGVRSTAREKDEDWLGLDEFMGTPFSRKWRPIELIVSMPLLPRPDFFNYGVGKFVCNERVTDLTLLEMSGELLPVHIKGEKGKFFIFNCTNTINVIDEKKSKWSTECGYKELIKPAFVPERFGEPTVFKIQEDAGVNLYCVQRTGDSEDSEFKALVGHHGLTGLEFELAWSDEKRAVRPSGSRKSKGA
jgi:hypothetical protein